MDRREIAKLNMLVAEYIFGWTGVGYNAQADELTGKDRRGTIGRVPDYANDQQIRNRIYQEMKAHHPEIAERYNLTDGVHLIQSDDDRLEMNSPVKSCLHALSLVVPYEIKSIVEIGDMKKTLGHMLIRISDDKVLVLSPLK